MQHRAGNAQDGERRVHDDARRVSTERCAREIDGEGIGDVGHADGTQECPERAAERPL